jgi:hypothetical protein
MKILSAFIFLCIALVNYAQISMPEILINNNTIEKNYLPDFSFAGYHFGEKQIPSNFDHTLNIIDFGAIANDNLDDTPAFIKTLNKAEELDGYVEIKIPSGTFELNQIIYISRSKTVIKGEGSGKEATIIHIQRPLRFVENPPELEELREYLVSQDKRQREPEYGIDILFSQYAWSGGYFWVGKKGARVKPYLSKYNQPLNTVANAISGKQGSFAIVVDNPTKLSKGSTYKFGWFNKDGKEGSFLKHMYDGQDVKIGSHHWTNPESPLVNQKVLITDIIGDTVFIKDPLLHDVKEEWYCSFNEWEHIEEVGIENLAFEFEIYPDMPHHIEEGNNAIYLTSLMNGWVSNVRFKNADSGVLTEDISNVTISNIRTHGEKLAHYSVALGEVHNVLVSKLKVENKVRHPLSFNTLSTKCVYTDCIVEQDPILDQHSGANEQNLFDNIKIYIDAPVHKTFQYPLFMSGGAGYWAPAHGAFNTFYNIEINFANIPNQQDKPILLNGVKEGISARIIGVHANHPVSIEYGPNAYIEQTNQTPSVKSLYEYQLQKRAPKKGFDGFLLLEESLLKKTKQEIKTGNKKLMPAYIELIKEAEADYLKPLPPSVTDKKFTPPGGDKHDYMSIGPYWWPDPNSPNGLPYIVKDGEVNPEREEYDRIPMGNLIERVRNLSLAFYFSEDEKYAEKTIQLLETWFLNPETKMNPNLKFGQAIKGKVTGRGIGIIDSHRFSKIPDAIRLIQNSDSYSPEFETNMKSWFSEYLDWLWNHEYGQDERNWHNNHGTAYDVLVSSLALYTGNIELGKLILNDVPYRRINTQIEPDGKQPLELKRTRSYNYTIGNLGHFVNLAILGKKMGIDLFNYSGNEGQSIKQVLNFLKPYIEGTKKWDYQQITPIESNQGTLYQILNTVAYYYNDNKFSEQASMLLPTQNNIFLSNLQFPPSEIFEEIE